METRVAVISIILEDSASVQAMNEINTLSGRIGRLSGVSAKAAYSK